MASVVKNVIRVDEAEIRGSRRESVINFDAVRINCNGTHDRFTVYNTWLSSLSTRLSTFQVAQKSS